MEDTVTMQIAFPQSLLGTYHASNIVQRDVRNKANIPHLERLKSWSKYATGFCCQAR